MMTNRAKRTLARMAAALAIAAAVPCAEAVMIGTPEDVAKKSEAEQALWYEEQVRQINEQMEKAAAARQKEAEKRMDAAVEAVAAQAAARREEIKLQTEGVAAEQDSPQPTVSFPLMVGLGLLLIVGAGVAVYSLSTVSADAPVPTMPRPGRPGTPGRK